jgi:hypothetical protein
MREDYLGDYKERVFRFDFVGHVEVEETEVKQRNPKLQRVEKLRRHSELAVVTMEYKLDET